MLVAATEGADAPNENTDEGDVAEAAAAAVDAVKRNPVDGDVVAGTDAVDAGKDNPAEEDVELKVEPNIWFGFVDCQLEPNKLEVVPPIVLVLASEEEAEEPTPKAAPELKSFAAEVEAANRELPEFAANPKDGDDEFELNCMGMLLLKVETPEPAVDPLPAPKREP